MRRFALVMAICGCCSSVAVAAPFDQLSSRLKQYDETAAPTPQAQQRPTRAQGDDYAAEEVSPGPMERGAYSDWHYDGPWDEPCSDGYCDCDPCCSSCCGSCGFWGRAEYIYWWLRGNSTPPLVTTSPDNTPQSSAGILPQATVLFGGERLNTSGRSGGRFTAGYWFDPCGTIGIESSTFFLGDVKDRFDASSSGSPILARPFFNVLTNTNDANLVAFPNVVLGTIRAETTSRAVGTELNVRKAFYTDCWRRFDVLAGYRFFQLSESLQVQTNTTAVDQQSTSIPVGTLFGIQDQFTTRNNFNGGQIGINAHYDGCCWSLDLLAKVAIGGVGQHVGITGTTVISPPNQETQNHSGGILALGSNMGSYQRGRFAVLPEFGANLHRRLNDCWSLNVGYTLLIISNVVRPGDQVDLRIDPNQFPPPAAPGQFPRFTFNDSEVWLQGINVGLECNF